MRCSPLNRALGLVGFGSSPIGYLVRSSLISKVGLKIVVMISVVIFINCGACSLFVKDRTKHIAIKESTNTVMIIRGDVFNRISRPV